MLPLLFPSASPTIFPIEQRNFMMKRLISLLLLSLSLPALSTVRIEEELFVIGQKPEVLKDLIKSGSVEIDHVSSNGFELFGPKGLAKHLEEMNIPHFDMKLINQKAFADYPTSAQFRQQMMNLAGKYPKIMKLYTIGKSNKGNDLLVMKISDNVTTDEVEPEFKYISSMHGDEITGRELMMNLISEIGEKYGSDQDITDLVNNSEIFIMPSMNPDGSDLKQRANAKGADLNRNFPDIKADTQSSPTGREVETQAIMAYQASRQFVLSANFHGGTVVANYPWDSIYDRHPLNDFVKQLSVEYAELNPEMRGSSQFPGGVTNGADWYVVKGGMQDWSYFWFKDLQITVELSTTKWPAYSEIAGFYKSNRDSMFHFMKAVHHGAGFKIQRSKASGTVAIEQISPAKSSLGSYAFNDSQFYKVMPEGEYEFTIQEKNRAAQKINVKVESNRIKSNGNYVSVP